MSEPSNVEPSPFCLVVIRAPARSPQPTGTAIELPLRGGLVGRTPNADVFLGDKSISRHHARLAPDEGGVLVTPLTASNGTWAVGRRLEIGEPPAFVALDQRLQLGGVVFCLASGGETEPVLEALASERLEPTFEVTWDAGHCVVRINGRLLRGVTGSNARFLGLLAEAEGTIVNLLDLEQDLKTTHIPPLATHARNALRDAIAEGILPRAFVLSRLAAARREVPLDAEPAELARALVANHRGHGYQLHLQPGDTRVVHV